MTQIKHRITGAVLHEGPGTLREELQKAASIADLRWANLSGADLSGADLSGANLSGAGVLCLHIGDPRGYRPVAVWHDQWVIFAGCRKFTIAQAREHWGVKYHGIRSTGDQYLAAMDWLEKQPKPEDVK